MKHFCAAGMDFDRPPRRLWAVMFAMTLLVTFWSIFRPIMQNRETEVLAAPYKGPGHAARDMHETVRLFHRDLLPWAHLSAEQVFRRIENIPYISDNEILGGNELTARPREALKLPGLDCKKKSILVASWATCRGLPYRFIAVGEAYDVTHVFCQVKLSPDAAWCSMDCTIKGLYDIGSGMPEVGIAYEV